MLRYGIDVLSKLPNATIYIEASASDWKSVGFTARTLRRIGVAKVSARLGGKHFVISTAMNGRGPVHFLRRKKRINVHCHPLFRGAGPYPTTNTSDPLVDAYFWINRAGYSGGSCNGGPLPVGTWWPKRALMFARYQSQQLFPKKGTKYGFKKGRFSIRNVASDGYRK